VHKAWRAVCKAAGLGGLGLHSLRHTFCSRLAAAGIPVTDIQALAGHASITTTSIYMRSGEPARKRAVKALDNPRGGEVVPFPAADPENTNLGGQGDTGATNGRHLPLTPCGGGGRLDLTTWSACASR